MIDSTMPRGGTELLHENLLRFVEPQFTSGINFLVNKTDTSAIVKGGVNVLWNHVNVDQPAISNLFDADFLNSINRIVFVSHWQYEKYRLLNPIIESKSIVIKNAAIPIEHFSKPDKIQLIYTSTPWRGLNVLLDAFELMNRDDVELVIYSSTLIYGSSFYNHAQPHFSALFERAKTVKNVKYMGYASNQDVRDALKQAHIFAYPSIWEETSCLSAIEAGMAGLQIVTTNLGALPETTSEWSTMVNYDSNHHLLARKFATCLSEAIDNYWSSSNQHKLKLQSKFFNEFWSWDLRAHEWRNFFLTLR